MSERLKIAIQKKGRLHDDSFALIKRIGLDIRISKTSLFCQGENLPIDLLLVRDDDIPTLVMDKVCDLGIVGENVLREQELLRLEHNHPSNIVKLQPLNFGRCRLSLAGPRSFELKDLKQLSHKRIATTYPYILQEFLAEQNVQAEIVELTGSVEVAPRLGIADLICDLVSTGETLAANNLVEITQVFQSEGVLIRNQAKLPENKEKLLKLLLNRIQGVLQAHDSKYILFHAPKKSLEKIKAMLPGCKTPTVMTLENDNDRVAVHVVSTEKIFWETLESIKAAGADSILVLPIEKMLT